MQKSTKLEFFNTFKNDYTIDMLYRDFDNLSDLEQSHRTKQLEVSLVSC